MRHRRRPKRKEDMSRLQFPRVRLLPTSDAVRTGNHWDPATSKLAGRDNVRVWQLLLAGSWIRKNLDGLTG